MSHWYSEPEVCVYHKAVLEVPLNETYIRVCDAKEAPHYPDKFGIGIGTMGRLSTKPCEPPFIGRRTHFEKELAGFPVTRRTNLSEVVLGLHEKNQSLIFLGDSITVQSFEAFKAEVMATNPLAAVKRGINYVMENKSRSDSTLVYSRCYRDAPNDCVVIELPDRPIMLVYFVWYSNRDTWPDSLRYLLKVTPYYSGMLVVINHGLWTYLKTDQIRKARAVSHSENSGNHSSGGNSSSIHSDMATYTPTVAEHFDFNFTRHLLLELKTVRARLLAEDGCSLHFVWRETSAGHFASKFGYLDDIFAAETEAQSCSRHHRSHRRTPAVTISTAYDTPLILSVLREHNMSDFITFVSFYQATLPLHNEHIGRPVGVKALDCVHFCWLPTLWQPLWAALSKVVASDL